MNNFLKRFYQYQNQRFPVFLLLLTFLPAILSSAAVTIGRTSSIQVIGLISASILYLLHIRVTDEIRDFAHDKKHHQLRPLHSGVISIKELQFADAWAVLLF